MTEKFWQNRTVTELRDLVRRLRKRAIFHKHVHPYNRRVGKQELIKMLSTKFHVRRMHNYPGRFVIRSRMVDFGFVFVFGRYFLDGSLQEEL